MYFKQNGNFHHSSQSLSVAFFSLTRGKINYEFGVYSPKYLVYSYMYSHIIELTSSISNI